MNLRTEPYLQQRERWPSTGRHILAQYDQESVVVYQAYRPSIGNFAAANGYFGGDFKLGRMSWIKPNFLWMMYRCGWASKEGQEVVLAIRLRRDAFDDILRQAVHSSFVEPVYGSRAHWQERVQSSDVRLQWDPDHAPNGAKEERRAIQLGLRGEVLRRYAREWILDIEDVSEFVRHERDKLDDLSQLRVPAEAVYPVEAGETSQRLGIAAVP